MTAPRFSVAALLGVALLAVSAPSVRAGPCGDIPAEWLLTTDHPCAAPNYSTACTAACQTMVDDWINTCNGAADETLEPTTIFAQAVFQPMLWNCDFEAAADYSTSNCSDMYERYSSCAVLGPCGEDAEGNCGAGCQACIDQMASACGTTGTFMQDNEPKTLSDPTIKLGLSLFTQECDWTNVGVGGSPNDDGNNNGDDMNNNSVAHSSFTMIAALLGSLAACLLTWW